tara:strand:- start:1161 stop:1439 length:279 start_codon:yes stop_codon:yes gene_type:complete
METFYNLLISMLVPSSDGQYSIVEAKSGKGFNCYEIELSKLDVNALNECLTSVGSELKATHFKPEKFGDVHRLYVGPRPQRKEANISKFFPA